MDTLCPGGKESWLVGRFRPRVAGCPRWVACGSRCRAGTDCTSGGYRPWGHALGSHGQLAPERGPGTALGCTVCCVCMFSTWSRSRVVRAPLVSLQQGTEDTRHKTR